MGAEQRSMDIITESYRLSRRCEVTAILILYGLPRYFHLFALITCQTHHHS